MKVCIVAPRFSYPENGGDVVLLNDIMHYFKDIGWNVIYLSYYEESQKKLIKEKHPYIDKYIGLKRSNVCSLFYAILAFVSDKPLQCGYYYSITMLKKLREVEKIERPDLYVCHLLRMIPFFMKLGIVNKVIIQMSDVLSNTYKLASSSKGSPIKKIIYKIEASRIDKYEKDSVQKFPKIVLVSQNDRAYFGNNIHVVYHNNGIRQILSEQRYDKNKIVFVGNMRTLQNIDGCLHFVNEIFPKILEYNKNAVLYIVGSSPNLVISNLQSNNIKITGYVDSIEEFIKDAAVSVAPIRVAAGIQNKILISMASHIPVILSSLTAKGIPELKNGENCFIEDDENSFAQKCLLMMNNYEYRKKITENASTVIKENYLWDKHLQNYELLPN